ncbi:DUF4232 domain-containing protein [Saccharopolyspora hirsuta]|uniref:DUF4232 domain-containing protein n=1 Tax=Saccharopolyspora hirsuta TaxID=1837 RepID=UPI00332550F1
MRAHTIGKTLLAAAVCAVSLSACGSLPTDSSTSAQVDNASNEDSTEPAPCTTEQVNPTFVLATTGSVAGHVTITNGGPESCLLDSSRPTVEFTNRDAQPIEEVSYQPGNPGSGPIELAPGESAAAELDWNDLGDNCVARVWAMNMSVRPGDPAKSVDPLLNDKPWVFDLCGHEVTVHGWQKA